jgi:hypothetical protein
MKEFKIKIGSFKKEMKVSQPESNGLFSNININEIKAT